MFLVYCDKLTLVSLICDAHENEMNIQRQTSVISNFLYIEVFTQVPWTSIYPSFTVPVFVLMRDHGDRDRDISPWWCSCMHGTSLGVLSAGRIPLMVIGCFTCGGGPVDCSDWMCLDCAVDFSPGRVWIGYIRQDLWDRSLTETRQSLGHLSSLLSLVAWTYIVLLDLLRVRHFVVRIVSYLLDLG